MSLDKAYDLDKLTDFVKSYVPEASLKDAYGSEVTMILPFPSVQTFPTLFNQLDEKKNELGISSYGASVQSSKNYHFFN